MATTFQLPFEQPIHEIEAQIRDLESRRSEDRPTSREQIRALRKQLTETIRSIYKNLDPWETVRVARHPERPMFTDYVDLVFDEFVELHGDKFFGDDRALRTGFAKLDEFKVLLVGHQKGKTLKERNECFFGCAHPEGYRKAMEKMKLAAKYGLPIIALIDTPGAYPGIGAEERGQAQVIAESMLEMSRLPTPIICVVIGEGGSGGALGIGVGDRVAVLRARLLLGHQPRGLRRHPVEEPRLRARRPPGRCKITSRHLLEMGVVDDVVEEPLGGAHRDHHQMGGRLKMYLIKNAPRAAEAADGRAAASSATKSSAGWGRTSKTPPTA